MIIRFTQNAKHLYGGILQEALLANAIGSPPGENCPLSAAGEENIASRRRPPAEIAWVANRGPDRGLAGLRRQETENYLLIAQGVDCRLDREILCLEVFVPGRLVGGIPSLYLTLGF
jgi:hypothetical protein